MAATKQAELPPELRGPDAARNPEAMKKMAEVMAKNPDMAKTMGEVGAGRGGACGGPAASCCFVNMCGEECE